MPLISSILDNFPRLLRRKRLQLTAGLPTGRTFQFPPGFLWGAATASHQAEGMDSGSDWWRFERTAPHMMGFADQPVFAQEYKSDHWRQFDGDVERMRDELGLSAYRFSIDWSRVEPREGQFDEAVIARYGEMVAELGANGISPLVTLFHWSSPDWIWDHARENETGWYSPDIVARFLRFVERIVPVLAPHVDLFVTLNEPNIFMYGGFSEGILAPGHHRKDRDMQPILDHLLQCHVGAYRIIKKHRPEAQVGIAHQFCPLEPESNGSPLEALVAGSMERTFTWLFPDVLKNGRYRMVTRDGTILRGEVPEAKGTADFMGVNYYERMLVRIPGGWNIFRTKVLNDHHDTKEIWPRDSNPAGFLALLKAVSERYQLPIYVTENGRSHPDDRARQAFLRDHLQVLGYAVDELKLPVKGYFWWSLLDNQEWANGFVPRLGLFEVDYANGGARTLRDTGRAYAEIIRSSRIST